LQVKAEVMGGKQLGLSDYELTTAKKQTKRENFFPEKKILVPWKSMTEQLWPHYCP
jgi:hypothetical protein